jgi:hypothetical protein
MMEIEQLEKQFQLWNRFMHVMLGSSITLVLISFGTIDYGTDWPGFSNYVGGIWTWIQILATAPGFFLLWGRRWKSLPFVNRLNTIIGYFVASWLSFLALGIITANDAPNEMIFLIVGSAVLITLGYIWAIKKTSVLRDEMFP